MVFHYLNINICHILNPERCTKGFPYLTCAMHEGVSVTELRSVPAVVPLHCVLLHVLRAGSLQLLLLRHPSTRRQCLLQDPGHHPTVRHPQWTPGMFTNIPYLYVYESLDSLDVPVCNQSIHRYQSATIVVCGL